MTAIYKFFAWIDGLTGALAPPFLHILTWGLLSGALSMLLYRWVSPQERLLAAQREAAAARRAMATFDGAFEEMMGLNRRMLSSSFRHMALAGGPAVLASVPLLAVLIWMSDYYAHVLPAVGADVVVHVEPSDVTVRWEPALSPGADPGVYALPWPSAASARTLYAGDTPLLSVPFERAQAVVDRGAWWSAAPTLQGLVLPAGTAVERVVFEFPHLELFAFGPAWLRTWEATFFAAMMTISLVLKFTLRIH